MRFMFVMSKFHQIPSCCHRWTTRNGAVFFMPSVSSTASCRNVVSLVPSDGVCPMSLTTQIWTPPCYSWRSIYPPPSWCLGRNIRNPSKSTDSHGNSWDFASDPPKPFLRLFASSFCGNVEGRGPHASFVLQSIGSPDFQSRQLPHSLHLSPQLLKSINVSSK